MIGGDLMANNSPNTNIFFVFWKFAFKYNNLRVIEMLYTVVYIVLLHIVVYSD